LKMLRSLISKFFFSALILVLVFTPISVAQASGSPNRTPQENGPALPTPTSNTSDGGLIYTFPSNSATPNQQPDPNDPNLTASGTGQPPSLSATSSLSYDDRDNSIPVAWYVYEHQNLSQVMSTAATYNLRIVDLFVEDPADPYQFSTIYVANSGAYSKPWWLLVNVNPTDLFNFTVSNQARIISQKAFNDPAPGGSVRFFAVMIANTGADAKSWWFYQGKTVSEITSLWIANNARLVQVNSYQKNTTTLYDVVMISNTGSDQRSWWWYVNASPADISNNLNANSARLVDLDLDPATGNFNAIMNSCPATCPAWSWYYNVPTSNLLNTALQSGSRIIDANSTAGCGDRCWSIVLIDNAHLNITGNAGIAFASLGYTDGTPKTATADASGNFFIKVPANWTGKITPSKPGVPSFRPAYRTVTNLSTNLAAQNFKPNSKAIFTSIAAQDGYIRESSETSSLGGALNLNSIILSIGDDTLKRQLRGFLSFNTAGLPDTAVILSAKLALTKQSITAISPFGSLGSLTIDLRKPNFGASAALQLDDFNATAGLTAAGVVGSTPVSGIYYSNLTGLAP
ncbi:MAG: hypothetical protein WCK35_30335, partial [Chloroflexota bacterium]